THRAGDLLDLVGEDGPGVEDHAVVRDAGDDRGVPCPQPRRQDLSRQTIGRQLNQPSLEGLAGERSAAHLRFALDRLGVLAHASLQRLSTPTYCRDVFGQHAEDWDLAPGGLWVA